MEREDYLRVLRSTWYLVVAVAVFGGAVAHSWAKNQPRTYESELTFLIAPSPSLAGDDQLVINATDTLRRNLVATMAEIVASQQSLSQALESVEGIVVGADDLDVSAAVAPESNAVVSSVSGTNPRLVHDIALRVADDAPRRFSELYPVYVVDVIQQPELDTEGSRISPLLVAIAGAGSSAAGAWFLLVGFYRVNRGVSRRRVLASVATVAVDDRRGKRA